ncbi:MAG: carboxymuconolactone decarboxylase family protein [Candidatus Eisenbacteria bacterium]|nr:carboxymuconolactone decarboxylase family protein [Candidatus Eisenbacteria bacterium]
MAEHPLQVLIENDPELIRLDGEGAAAEFSDGALPKKTKLLIALAIDASMGAAGGVHALAREALEAGATREEILETVRVVHFVGGHGKLHVAAQGLKGVL